MLRDLVLTICVLGCLWLTIKRPYAGVLAWTWLTLMQPHREVYGPISATLRINFTVAFVCILAWYFSKDRKQMPEPDGPIVALGLFLVWMTFNTFFSVDPGWSWQIWDRNWKIIALAFMIWATATNKIRIYSLIWVIVASLLYYGVKDGILSVLFAGGKKISGPVGTAIADNNNVAVAFLMTLPLINYLRTHAANHLVRLALMAGFAATLLSVVSSYSRGAFVAMVALAFVGWIRSRNKILYLIFGAALLVPIYYFMPPEYYARIATLNDTDNDGSFQGRVLAWKVAFYYAVEHFPLGAGLDGPQFPSVFHRYFPSADTHAAHSIYFEVLGDTGFMGLAIYLTILVLAFVNCARIRKATRNKPEMAWAFDLATSIQLSLVAFCVGGAALSLAYYDMALIWMGGVLPALWRIVRAMQPQREKLHSMPQQAFGSIGKANPT